MVLISESDVGPILKSYIDPNAKPEECTNKDWSHLDPIFSSINQLKKFSSLDSNNFYCALTSLLIYFTCPLSLWKSSFAFLHNHTSHRLRCLKLITSTSIVIPSSNIFTSSLDTTLFVRLHVVRVFLSVQFNSSGFKGSTDVK